MPLGVQAHNSSTGSGLIRRALRTLKLFGGNTLEAPVYWNQMEKEEGSFDLSLIKELIDEVRSEGKHLILLWFGMSKNGHPNYVPEYVKLHPGIYHIAKGPDGAPVASLSPHCKATLEKDCRAFGELMRFLKEYDEAEKTVLAVQIENEMGYANTDRDYSEEAEQDYQALVPTELKNVEIPDAWGETAPFGRNGLSPWKAAFGRYSHEVFSAWYTAVYVGTLAKEGKGIYDIPLYTNVMIGESGFEEAGLCYNAGAAVSRMLDIWKAAAPELDFIAPDIYNPTRYDYDRICRAYHRRDNPLVIPESPIRGEANAMNLIRYHGTEHIYAFAQEEFETYRYLKLPDYHINMKYTNCNPSRYGYTCNVWTESGKKKISTRGRAILVQTAPEEFYLCGAGAMAEFIRRPSPESEDSYRQLSSRQFSQLNFLSVEEGHFENGEWMCEFIRNGDETNFAQYVLDGQMIRIRLNPKVE